MKSRTRTMLLCASIILMLGAGFSWPALAGRNKTPGTDSAKETAGQPVGERASATADTRRALFLIQNEDYASYYQERTAADEHVQVVVVSSLDAFLERAAGAHAESPAPALGWDIVMAILDPNAPENQGEFEYCADLCESMISDESARVTLVTEQGAPSMPDLASSATGRTEASVVRTPPMRYNARTDRSHVRALYSCDGSYQIIEIDGRAESLVQFGAMLNQNRFDFSIPPDLGGPRAPDAPFCCGFVWVACMNTTCSDGCGIMFIPCFFNWVENPCHSMDGQCGACPGSYYRCFYLCNDPLCAPPDPVWDCGC